MQAIEDLLPEDSRRIEIWRMLATEMHQCLLVEEELWNKNFDTDINDRFVTYIINRKEHHFDKYHRMRESIYTKCVISFWVIHGQGKRGDGFSDNHSEIVSTFRSNLEEWVTSELGWTKKRYLKLKTKIQLMRHEQVAHYDGSKADFSSEQEGAITKYRSPGAWFDRKEIIDFKKMIAMTCEYFEKYYQGTV